MFKAKNRRVHALSCIMGNAENPNFSIGIHSPLALPYQVPVVQKVVSTIHWIMLLIFVLLYPVDSDLSGGYCLPTFEQLGPEQGGRKLKGFYRYSRPTYSFLIY